MSVEDSSVTKKVCQSPGCGAEVIVPDEAELIVCERCDPMNGWPLRPEKASDEPIGGKLVGTQGIKGWCVVCMKAYRSMLTLYRFESMMTLHCSVCGGRVSKLVLSPHDRSRVASNRIFELELERLLLEIEHQHSEKREKYSFEASPVVGEVEAMVAGLVDGAKWELPI